MMLLPCQNVSYTSNSPPIWTGYRKPIRDSEAKEAEKISRDLICKNQRISRDLICKNQRLKEAFELGYSKKQPNSPIELSSYGPLLQVCSRERCLQGGLQLHAHMIKRGIESDWFLQNSLLNLYIECENLHYARMVFDNGDVKTTLISWNSIIAMYCRFGFVEEALVLFLELQMCGLVPDQYTLPPVIGVIERRNELSLGRQFHSLSVKLGYGNEEFVANSLIKMYASIGDINDSIQVFDETSKTMNPITWNSMIARLVENGFHEDALMLYNRMQGIGIQSTPLTFSSLLKACAALEAISEGKQVHAQMMIRGFLPNMILKTALLDFYTKCGELENGRQIFDAMEERSVVTWNSMIRGYSYMGYTEEALKLFQIMRREEAIPDKFTFPALLSGVILGDYVPQEFRSIHAHIIKVGLETNHFIGTSLISMYSTNQSTEYARLAFDDTNSRDVGVWCSMISTYVKSRDSEDALWLFTNMLHLGIIPNDFIYSSLFTVSGDLPALEMGKQIQAYSIKSIDSFDVPMMNSLMTMYSNCGCIVEAWKIFESIENPTVISFNSMISALAQHGLPDRAAQLFRRMKLVGPRPDEITLLNLLSAYNHAGLVDKGLELFNSMEDNYGVSSRYEHYACIADMLARAGEIEDAIRFIDEMPFEPEPSLWRIMLGACGKHRNIRVGRQVAELLLELEPNEAVNYVLLANINARTGRWVEAERVRHLMIERRTEREVAVSWIEINRRTHTFRAEDRSHPSSEEIYSKLQELIRKMKAVGYVPDISFTLHDVEDERREESLFYHSEKLAFAYGVISTAQGRTLRIMKNLRVCGDCHSAFKYFSLITSREIVLRDNYRFHHFNSGVCSCGDYW